MSSNYFQHPWLSNSDLKDFKKKIGMAFEDPIALQQIFDFGSLFHSVILEPHEANRIIQRSELNPEQIDLAKAMAKTYWDDPICRQFAMASDFVREHPMYEEREVGPYLVRLRCKCDGARMRLGVQLELKGLGVDSEKAFREALIRYDYDQAISHYMIVGGFKMALIVGISKKDPTKLYKWYCKRHDEFFLNGEEKLIQTLKLLREYSPEDVPLKKAA